MRKNLFLLALVAAYFLGYSDYLQPGFLKFGIPAAWDKPFTTSQSYDLGAGVRHTAECTVREAIPAWAKPADWFRDRSKEPKTCRQLLKEAEDK